MLSAREREALIMGLIIGLAAVLISGFFATVPLWIQIMAVVIAGILLCMIATRFT